MMCAGCPHRGLFYTLAKNKITALGDIGCYTLGAVPPLNALDSTLCMGASVSGLHGFNLARGAEAEKKSVAVIGDSTFMHSGITGLVNIAYNGSNSTVIILDNSITGMTGHQQNPTTGYNIKGDPAAKIDLETLCRAVGIERVRVVDPYDLAACEAVLKEELAADAPSVIISRRPCVLLKSVKTLPPVAVDADKCRSCKKCMKLGCPAIRMRDGKADIDALTETQFSNYLDSAGVPDPELVIRPSGELRTSNFLPWQTVYSEFVFMNVLWPDFSPEDLDAAIAEYHRRNRRFGGA